jgi:hypothetical protein
MGHIVQSSWLAALWLGVGVGLTFAGGACAQEAVVSGLAGTGVDSNSIDSSSFDRGRNISVRQEPRPDYQAEGVLVGGFTVYPKISLDVAYDDNIFALQTGRVGDFIFSQVPEIDIQSHWSRNALNAYVRAQQDEYVNNPSEDATQYGAGVNGKFEFGQSDLTGGVDYAHDVLPRSASNNVGFSVHRIPYDYTAFQAQLATTFTRVRLAVRVDDQTYDYQNGQTATGATVFEQDQNRNVLTVTGKAEVALSPDAAVYLTAAGNQRVYELNPPTVAFTRNSSGYEVDAGANFDLTHLVRGEVQLGYLDQRYDSPLFKPIDGPSAKAQLQWFPTPLTTVTAIALRAVGDAGVPNSAGFLTTNGSIQVDHELRRNVILTASTWVGHDAYNGIDRNDDRWGAGLSADWLLTRHVGLNFAYTYADQRSSGSDAGPTFADNRISVSALLQY